MLLGFPGFAPVRRQTDPSPPVTFRRIVLHKPELRSVRHSLLVSLATMWLIFRASDMRLFLKQPASRYPLPKYVKSGDLALKAHPEFNQKWVQARVAEDPKIPGLGGLVLLHQEKMQPPGGRLDLLLQDTEKRRYEVELELGVDREKADNPHVRILGSQEKVLSRNTIAVRDSLPRPALADLWTVIHFLMRHFTRNNSAAGGFNRRQYGIDL